MNILVLEDDDTQAEWINTQLVKEFPQAQVQLVYTEAEFRFFITNAREAIPDVVVLDMMVPWDDPTPEAKPVPDDIRDGGPYRAGLRCIRLLTEEQRTKHIPIILHTILDRSDLQSEIQNLRPNVIFCPKGSGAEHLLKLIRSCVALARPLPKNKALNTDILQTIFLAHGHDREAKETVARFIEKLGFQLIVLHEQPNAGRTIIEKFEDCSDVAFAVILLTPDDVGAPAGRPGKLLSRTAKPRARQNVVLELGYFLAKLGRQRVCALYKGDIEIPSDYDGVLYVPMDSGGAWRLHLAKEMKEAGLTIDLARVF